MVKVECTEAGAVGNVAANTIKIPDKAIPGITSITNPKPFTGGTDQETDDAYRERVIAAYEEFLSGSDSDYKRWAKEVPGVGQAYVIPEWEGFGTGTTKILILDSNGQPANETLIERVQNYIAPLVTKNRGGLAPINANVTVAAPDIITINIKANIYFDDQYDRESVEKELIKNLRDYLGSIEITTEDESLQYVHPHMIGHRILSTKGIKLYENLYLNGDSKPILIPMGEVPALGEVIIL